ncbi:hypothetical protein [Spirillospora albida]|uniref:hypothetical protein n=1 Tax=Spirillospora albida TaxID=58123 RepID=UPI0004BEBA63|nr:hypothetical protein [Spirillospora albida]
MAAGRYRSVFHTGLPADEAFSVAEQQIRSWLGHKHLDQEAFDRGAARVGPDGQLMLVLARNTPDGAQTKRWQLREPRAEGTWVSTLTVHGPGRSRDGVRSWFWLDIELLAPPAGEPDEDVPPKPKRPGVPQLVRGLLDVLDARDSLTLLREKPILVRPPDIDALIHVVCDPERRMPVIVASAHPHRDFETWRGTVEHATRFTAGLAGLYLLDPHATEQFNREIGDTHGVWGGGVRTYLPDADPASADDSLRHRVLSSKWIEDGQNRTRVLLAGLPYRLSSEALLPRPLAGLSRALLSDASLGLGSPPSRAPESEARPEDVEKLRENLEAALELVAEAEKTEEKLARRNDELIALSAEFDAVNQRAEFLRDQVKTLRRLLVRAGRAADAHAPADERTRLPATFAEALDRLEKELPRVVFTGDLDHPLELDERPSASSWAQTAWQAMRAMNDYAEASAAGSFAGGFPAWCKNPPTGAHAISAGKVAPDESETVKNDRKMRRARLLPVPEAVDASGKVFMGAHVRLGGGGGMSAPRMHYADDVKGTGKIYVGYLGPHLPVKSTN